MGKTKKKTLSSPESVKAVRWKGWDLWLEKFQEKVPFEFRVEKSRSAVVMDSDSGDNETDELRQFGWEEWEKEWSGLD